MTSRVQFLDFSGDLHFMPSEAVFSLRVEEGDEDATALSIQIEQRRGAILFLPLEIADADPELFQGVSGSDRKGDLAAVAKFLQSRAVNWFGRNTGEALKAYDLLFTARGHYELAAHRSLSNAANAVLDLVRFLCRTASVEEFFKEENASKWGEVLKRSKTSPALLSAEFSHTILNLFLSEERPGGETSITEDLQAMSQGTDLERKGAEILGEVPELYAKFRTRLQEFRTLQRRLSIVDGTLADALTYVHAPHKDD